MNSLRAKQRGVSGSGFIAIIAIIVILVLLLLKLFPVYMENFNVSTSLSSLSSEEGIKALKKSAIKELLQRRFSINDVENVRKEHIEIKKTKTDMTIDITYEVRKPLVGNVDIVIHFSEHLAL
ncbi:MAG: DUF4845 domain-containing protein [Gammaproteobacteria bacterium]|nr:DUF4845 domain-containing protein [Gammaproteobacteria bacterium]